MMNTLTHQGVSCYDDDRILWGESCRVPARAAFEIRAGSPVEKSCVLSMSLLASTGTLNS